MSLLMFATRANTLGDVWTASSMSRCGFICQLHSRSARSDQYLSAGIIKASSALMSTLGGRADALLSN